MEPVQRCVPGPGAWVDWRRERVFFLFVSRLRSRLVFQERDESRRSTFSNLFTLSLSLSLCFAKVCICKRESDHDGRSQWTPTSGKRTSPGVAREGMRMIPSRMKKRGESSERIEKVWS
jgi:hypothetical protein